MSSLTGVTNDKKKVKWHGVYKIAENKPGDRHLLFPHHPHIQSISFGNYLINNISLQPISPIITCEFLEQFSNHFSHFQYCLSHIHSFDKGCHNALLKMLPILTSFNDSKELQQGFNPSLRMVVWVSGPHKIMCEIFKYF